MRLFLSLDLSNPFQLYPTNSFSVVNTYLTWSIFAQSLLSIFLLWNLLLPWRYCFFCSCSKEKATYFLIPTHSQPEGSQNSLDLVSPFQYNSFIFSSHLPSQKVWSCSLPPLLHLLFHPFSLPSPSSSISLRPLSHISWSHPNDLAKTQTQPCLPSA